MDENATDGNASDRGYTTTTQRILSDLTIQSLARIPDHQLSLRFLFTEYGITKRDLLRSYVTREIESSPAPTGTLVQWLELTFPEDIRVAIIREGQEVAAEATTRLARAVTELLSEMRAARPALPAVG